ncbi:MAG TPA: AI-2E family transporter [Methylotenera sp.]|nr:AI-2E family transporter [Methylotenera sp.]
MTKKTLIPPSTVYEIAAWVLTASVLLLVLQFKLLPALLAGLLVFELVHIITPYIARQFPTKHPSNRAKLWAVGILVTVIVSLLALAAAGLVAFLRSDSGSLTVLLAKMAQIIEDSRKVLPGWLLEHLPEDALAFKDQATAWLRSHAGELQVVGKEAGRATAHVILGMIIGGMLALRDVVTIDHFKPFAGALVGRSSLLSDAFRRVVFAQVRIAAINAFFTAVYLALVLPLMGVQLPLVKTMIAFTFVVGLIPVIGNLISNTVIVIVSLSQSLTVAIASLVYLVVIHKFEYFLNAKIVGTQIRANAWELLIAMLVMEAAFGLAGIVAAPIYYAYIKAELRARDLV